MVERMRQLGSLFYKYLNPTNEYVLVTCPVTGAPPPMTFILGISTTVYQGSIRRQIHWMKLSLGYLGPGTLLIAGRKSKFSWSFVFFLSVLVSVLWLGRDTTTLPTLMKDSI